jgi:inner membrane protein
MDYRILRSFDDTWFYGDTLFIIDPWVWLLAAAGVVLARSASRPLWAAWVVLGGLTSGLILTSDLVSGGVKSLWLIGLAVIVTLRWRQPSPALAQRVAQVSFAALVMYMCMAYGLARLAEQAWADEGGAATQVQANPIPGIPRAHRLVVVQDDHYRVVSADGDVQQIPREPPNAIVQQAMADRSIRGFINWSRFLYWDLDEYDDYWMVTFRDLRYSMPDDRQAGIGYAQVRVPKQKSEAAH